MVLTTPFHPRLVELNESQLWQHWAGYLSADRYDLSARQEHTVLRNAARLVRHLAVEQVLDPRP